MLWFRIPLGAAHFFTMAVPGVGFQIIVLFMPRSVFKSVYIRCMLT